MPMLASPDLRRQENALTNRTKLPPAAVIQSGTDLPFSQILEEDHESESAVEYSATHSRRTSFMNLPKVISQHTPNDSHLKTYCDFINEARAGSQLSEQCPYSSMSERPSLSQCKNNRASIAINTTSKKQS